MAVGDAVAVGAFFLNAVVVILGAMQLRQQKTEAEKQRQETRKLNRSSVQFEHKISRLNRFHDLATDILKSCLELIAISIDNEERKTFARGVHAKIFEMILLAQAIDDSKLMEHSRETALNLGKYRSKDDDGNVVGELADALTNASTRASDLLNELINEHDLDTW